MLKYLSCNKIECKYMEMSILLMPLGYQIQNWQKLILNFQIWKAFGTLSIYLYVPDLTGQKFKHSYNLKSIVLKNSLSSQ